MIPPPLWGVRSRDVFDIVTADACPTTCRTDLASPAGGWDGRPPLVGDHTEVVG